MQHYYSRLVAAIILGVLLCGHAYPQQPKEGASFKLFNISDAVYWAGAGLDLGSSLNKHESNPLFRDQNGIFTPGRNLAAKAGLFGVFKLLEYKYNTKQERRVIGWLKISAGIGFAALAVRNFGVKKQIGK